MTTTYRGSCHCGRIAFEVEGELTDATACNCSICQRKGTLMWFVPRAQLRLLTPQESMATYTFNKHHILHRFCPTCGIHPFGEATDPKGNAMAAVNIRCLEEVDLATIPVQQFDGKAK
ncbi:GFA family protein [Pusillimonas sp. ANT_WB101]|uniref:GFA family protein n=1 Tax=Pusillimonas sp. ANT_WB101 TaxID=2597356 RepID=UPI0011ED82C9|nr:GFA family protein [Pusillimonas sp. ANT_WB101]KAA0892495.1 GFA family protein [Pusillimonas sp. ANT_WB101]